MEKDSDTSSENPNPNPRSPTAGGSQTAPAAFSTSENPDCTTSPRRAEEPEPAPAETTRKPFTSLSQIEADLALARTLQDQEEALMLIQANAFGYGDGYDFDYGSGSGNGGGYGYEEEGNPDEGDNPEQENYEDNPDDNDYNYEVEGNPEYGFEQGHMDQGADHEFDNNYEDNNLYEDAETEFYSCEEDLEADEPYSGDQLDSHVSLSGAAIENNGNNGAAEDTLEESGHGWMEYEKEWNHENHYPYQQGGEWNAENEDADQRDTRWIAGNQNYDQYAGEESARDYNASADGWDQYAGEEGGLDHDAGGWSVEIQGVALDGWDQYVGEEGGWDEDARNGGDHNAGGWRSAENQGFAPGAWDWNHVVHQYHENLGANSNDSENLLYEELIALSELVGTESRGLAAETIASLPSITYKALQLGEEGNTDACVICQMEYEDGETLLVLRCKHAYHPECINRWLQMNKVCPVCNSEVSAS